MRVLFLVFVTIVTARVTNPQRQLYDLEDEIREKLENLRSTVRGSISAAISSVDNMMRQLFSFRNYAMLSATSAARELFQTFNNQITTLKDLAHAANQNIDVCLENNEPLLTDLYEDVVNILWECLTFADREMSIIQKEANYKIDTLMSEVNMFDFQVDLCAGDFLCMSSLITEIELAMIKIPQKIGLEVEQVNELFNELKVLIQECMDSKLAHITTEGGAIVTKITDCVNNILIV
ncbi:hypothetical protein Zmor_000795 [Zophobas morio]|uniref:Secreted protein n=1 Tax=Zophobas morio TaxID=2755281 RepID=A0AA38J766_9CUCU|nr:hypothetical protein Zmor_000795 [Zophobas morio]